MNPRGKSVKRGGLARICMQIRCFHYRSTITEREMERERERSAQRRESTRTTLGRCSAAGRGGESTVFYRGAKYKLEFSSHARSSGFSSTTILSPLLSPGARGSFQPTIVTLVEITSVDVTPAR